jgi:hypothetical protein
LLEEVQELETKSREMGRAMLRDSNGKRWATLHPHPTPTPPSSHMQKLDVVAMLCQGGRFQVSRL